MDAYSDVHVIAALEARRAAVRAKGLRSSEQTFHDVRQSTVRQAARKTGHRLLGDQGAADRSTVHVD